MLDVYKRQSAYTVSAAARGQRERRGGALKAPFTHLILTIIISKMCIRDRSSAVRIIERMDAENILFIPDKNLGRYVQMKVKGKNFASVSYTHLHPYKNLHTLLLSAPPSHRASAGHNRCSLHRGLSAEDAGQK